MVFPATIQASKDRPDKKRREREREREREVLPATTPDDGVPSYDSSVQGLARERGGVPECCIQEHPKRGEGRGEREKGGKRIEAPDRLPLWSPNGLSEDCLLGIQ